MDNGFDKYKIIDFTRETCGILGTEYLAMNGFNVLRVEKPSQDSLSKAERAEFVVNNLNKKCITLDVEIEKGKTLFVELIKKADALVENQPYGYMEKLGLGYEEIKKSILH